MLNYVLCLLIQKTGTFSYQRAFDWKQLNEAWLKLDTLRYYNTVISNSVD